MRILVLVPALAALLASPAFGWTCPARGGPEWREYKTAHFLLDTDMSRFKVEGLIKSLETMRGLVLNGLFNEQVDVPGRVRVVAPASPSDFATLAGSPDVGAYFKTSWHDEPLIAMPVVGSRASDEVVAHELAHLLSHYEFPEQPAWFAEGLAAFLQTVAKPEEQRQNASAQFSHIVRGASTQGPSVGTMPTDFMYAFSQNQQRRPFPPVQLAPVPLALEPARQAVHRVPEAPRRRRRSGRGLEGGVPGVRSCAAGDAGQPRRRARGVREVSAVRVLQGDDERLPEVHRG